MRKINNPFLKRQVIIFSIDMILTFLLFFTINYIIIQANLMFRESVNLDVLYMNLSFLKNYKKMILTTFLWGITLYINGFYDVTQLGSHSRNFSILAKSMIIVTVISGFIFYIKPYLEFSRWVLLLHGTETCVILMLERELLALIFRTERLKKNILIIGTGESAKEIAKEIVGMSNINEEIRGFLDDEKTGFVQTEYIADRIAVFRILGKTDDYLRLIKKESINEVVWTSDGKQELNFRDMYLNCARENVNVLTMVEKYEILTKKIPIKFVDEEWIELEVIRKAEAKTRIFYRWFDVLVSLIGIVAFAVFIPLILIGILLSGRGGIIYRQTRCGQNGRIFTLYKFRTMKPDAEQADKPVWSTKNDKRITWFGRLLRKIRFDEIPQIVNILKGDMSIVGPRPERPEIVQELQDKIPYYNIRHIIKPGLTGLAQINYSYGSTVEDAKEKLKYDLYYIKNKSFFLDMTVVLKTVRIVLTGQGAR